MAFTARLAFLSQFVASEIADTTTSPSVSSQGTTRVFDGAGMSGNFLSNGTPDLYGRVIDISMALAAADNNIDLTAAPLAADITKTVDLTGKKLIGYALKAAATNVGNITVKPRPTTDPYDLFIGSGEQRTLEPGRQLQSMVAEGEVSGAAAIDATHKNIRVSGTVADVLIATLIFSD